MLSNITFKHRLIGAIFLVSLAVILIPAFFDAPKVDTLAGKESSPQAPVLAEGEELTKIEYSFTELMTDLPQEVEKPADASLAATEMTAELATETVASEIVEEQTPVAAESEPGVIATTEKLITDNAWAVQLGAFSKPENAQDLLGRLKEEGYMAYTEHMPQTQLTRVLVGAEPNRKQAAELLAKLDETMHLKGIIVKLSP